MYVYIYILAWQAIACRVANSQRRWKQLSMPTDMS